MSKNTATCTKFSEVHHDTRLRQKGAWEEKKVVDSNLSEGNAANHSGLSGCHKQDILDPCKVSHSDTFVPYQDKKVKEAVHLEFSIHVFVIVISSTA